MLKRLTKFLINETTAPEQCNDRILDDKNYCILDPFYKYFEDQLRTDAARIETEYEKRYYKIFNTNTTLSISLKNIPREALSQHADSDGYTLLEKYIGFDKSVSDSEAATTALIMGKYNVKINSSNKTRYKECKKHIVLPINLDTACIRLTGMLRLSLITRFFTKPHTISVYNDSRYLKLSDGSQVLKNDFQYILSWIIIPEKKGSDSHLILEAPCM
jgi:hypothetical protein